MMLEPITIQSSQAIALPSPRVAISIRAATMDDLSFIDSLQKKTSKMVGFMPTKQLEGKIANGEIIVAWASRPCASDSEAFTGGTPVPRSAERVGYLIGCHRYFKHDDVGIIYAINVVPEYRRSLIAASLLKAQFERSAYGCKLYCCWCAQDIEANRFWESLGFVSLAFRAGSEKKARVHIFWQKRIRSGDATTPWWFPSKTTGGSIREDRIVLPIPPGTHWSDAKPIILPGDDSCRVGFNPPSLPSPRKKNGGLKPTLPKTEKAAPIGNGLLYSIPQPGEALAKIQATPKAKVARVKTKTDPKLVAAARELRDRWLEQVNASAVATSAKYDVTRWIESTSFPSDGGAAALPLQGRRFLPAA